MTTPSCSQHTMLRRHGSTRKRGIVFSMAVLLTGFSLFTIAVLLTESSIIRQKDVGTQTLALRMQDEVTAIQRGLRGVLEIYDFNVSVVDQTKTVTITEELPFTSTSAYEDNLEDWKAFTESNSNFNLTVTVTQLSTSLPFFINNNVTYLHTNGLGGTKVTIENGSLVANYTLILDVNQSGTVSAVWEEQHAGTSFFALTTRTLNDSFSGTWLLDYTKGNELKLTIDGSEIGVQVGKGNDPGFLKVDNEGRLPLTLTTNITLNVPEGVQVTLPSSIINITAPQYNMSRVTTAVVAKG